MQIVDILAEDLIVPALRASTKRAFIQEVVGHVASVRPQVDQAAAIKVLTDRERLGSTGVGNGFAVPHGKLKGLDGVVACFARSPTGVDFDALDGKPAYLFLTLLAPEGSAGMHLKALARASRLFKDDAFRSALVAQEDRAKLWAMIRQRDALLAGGEDVRGRGA